MSQELQGFHGDRIEIERAPEARGGLIEHAVGDEEAPQLDMHLWDAGHAGDGFFQCRSRGLDSADLLLGRHVFVERLLVQDVGVAGAAISFDHAGLIAARGEDIAELYEKVGIGGRARTAATINASASAKRFCLSRKEP